MYLISQECQNIRYARRRHSNQAIVQTLQAQQSKRDAHYHTAHLLAIMTKLMPNWLPEELFNLLHQQWNSPTRRARLAIIPALAWATWMIRGHTCWLEQYHILNSVSKRSCIIVPYASSCAGDDSDAVAWAPVYLLAIL